MDTGLSIHKLELCIEVDLENPGQSDSKEIYGWFNLSTYENLNAWSRIAIQVDKSLNNDCDYVEIKKREKNSAQKTSIVYKGHKSHVKTLYKLF